MTDQSKPSTSQSCEHDKGTIWRTETGNGGFGVCSKVVPCPFCKPTAVEPSVESIARSISHNRWDRNIRQDDFINMIAEALRNERNRKCTPRSK